MLLNKWDEEEARREKEGQEKEDREYDARNAGTSGELLVFAGLGAFYLLLVVFLLDVLQI